MKNLEKKDKNISINSPKYYEFCLYGSQKTTVRVKIALFSILTNGFLFVSLFFGDLSSFALYVFIPQFLAFLMGMISVFFLLPLYSKCENLQKKNVEDVTKATKGYHLSKIALLIASIIGRIVIVSSTAGSNSFGLELILLLLAVIFGALSIYELMIIKGISYKEKSPEEK